MKQETAAVFSQNQGGPDFWQSLSPLPEQFLVPIPITNAHLPSCCWTTQNLIKPVVLQHSPAHGPTDQIQLYIL